MLRKRQPKRMQQTNLKTKYENLKKQINTIAKQCDNEQVSLLAVSKSQPAGMIEELYRCGQRSFGENYAQELATKVEALNHLDIEWHYLGKIQSNKIKSLAKHANVIHSLCKQHHIEKLQLELGKIKKYVDVYLNVNICAELQKDGCTPEEAIDLAKIIENECKNLNLLGLMAIPPKTYGDDEYTLPPEPYLKLGALCKTIGKPALSLGMTRDMRIAIMAGSSIVRVGTAIFGKRQEAK